MTLLKSLYQTHSGKTSDKWSIYLDQYEEKFLPYKDFPIKLLEIGIQNGGSLEIYSKYFANAELILGCDINLKCKDLTYDDPCIEIIVGDVNSKEVFDQISKKEKFDLIIEDGSHTSPDIVKAFCKFFNSLKDGGLFIVEDLHCSYWGHFTGGLFHPLSSINFFKRLVDVINHEHWGLNQEKKWLLRSFALNYGVDISSVQLENIHSIEFANSLCFIRKKNPAQNVLGERIVSGTHAIVDSAPISAKGTISLAQDQSQNSWSNRQLTPEEELIACKREIKELKEKIETLSKV